MPGMPGMFWPDLNIPPGPLQKHSWRATSRNVKRTQENFSPEVSKIGVSELLNTAFPHSAVVSDGEGEGK
jgi:hypothetical protein